MTTVKQIEGDFHAFQGLTFVIHSGPDVHTFNPASQEPKPPLGRSYLRLAVVEALI